MGYKGCATQSYVQKDLLISCPQDFYWIQGQQYLVVRLRSLSDEDHKTITKSESSAVSANGMPLDVRGQVKLVVSIGSFTCEHTFIVICDLTVDCILGADFLKKHGAVIDCKSGILSLGTHIILLHTGQQSHAFTTRHS